MNLGEGSKVCQCVYVNENGLKLLTLLKETFKYIANNIEKQLGGTKIAKSTSTFGLFGQQSTTKIQTYNLHLGNPVLYEEK